MDKFVVPFLVFLGIVASFTRELVLAYYYGASSTVDVFRVATYIPLVLFQSLGAVFVGLYLARLSSGWNQENFEESTIYIFRFCLVVSLAGSILAPFYADILAPGLSDESRPDLISSLVISWIGYMLASLYFQSRIFLQLQEKKYLVSATSMLLSIFFCVMIFVGNLLDYKSSQSLSLYLVISLFLVSLLYIWQSKSLGLSIWRLFENALKPSKNSVVSPFTFTMAIITFFLLIVMVRVIDRAFVSEGGEGSIACLDYAYNLYTAFGLMIGTSSVIIYSGKISQLNHNRSGINGFLLVALPTFAVSVVVSIIAYFVSEETIQIVYSRGEFNARYLDLTHGFYQWLLLPLPLMITNMLLMQYLLVGGGIFMLSMGVLKLASKVIVISMLSSNLVVAVGVSNFFSELVFFVIVLIGIMLIGNKHSGHV